MKKLFIFIIFLILPIFVFSQLLTDSNDCVKECENECEPYKIALIVLSVFFTIVLIIVITFTCIICDCCFGLLKFNIAIFGPLLSKNYDKN